MRPSLVLLRRALVVASVLLAAACGSDPTASPPTKPTGDLTIVQVRAGAPALTGTVRTFYARYDQDREVRLYFRSPTSGADSTEYLRFRVRPRSLATRPGGVRFGGADSVLITITILDASRFLASFEPSGLRFDASQPAELRWKLAEKDDDLNEDGRVDDSDAQLVSQLAVWRQEALGMPWVRTPSQVSVENDEITADVFGFSNYAVAY